MRKFLFIVFLVFFVWGIFWGEKLPINPNTFSEWFSGKIVLGTMAGIFFLAFVISFFEKKEKKEKPMATPKYYYLRGGRK